MSHTLCWSGVPEGFGWAIVAAGPPHGHSPMLAGSGTVSGWPGVSLFMKSPCLSGLPYSLASFPGEQRRSTWRLCDQPRSHPFHCLVLAEAVTEVPRF